MVGRFLVFLGGVLVVALFAALLAPWFVDWTDFRRNFEDEASRILGKKVVVQGSVDARLLPFPSVTLHDVTVGQDEHGLPLVHVARFSMDAELAPLLSGEARIFDMRVENPRVRMRLLADGTLDWMRGGRPSIPARTVVLENIHVSGGVIEFIDDQTNRTRRVTSLNAEMAAASLAGPWTIDGSAALDGEGGSFHLSSLQPAVAGGPVPIKLRVQPDKQPFDLDLDGQLSVEEGRPAYKGNFGASWKAPEAPAVDGPARPAPTVKGAFELANDRIRVPSYRLELGTTDNPYAVTGEATLDTGRAPEFLLTAEGQQIDVSRIDGDGMKGKTGRDPAVSVRERLNRLLQLAAAVPIPEVPGRATLSLPAIVAGDTVIRDIKLNVSPAGTGWQIENAVAILPGRTQVEAKGRLSLANEPAFAGEMLVASTQPSGLAAWLSGTVDPAIRQLESAGFSALVNLTPELQRFEKLELAVGRDLLNGRLERQSFADARPNLSFDLTGNALDLNAMQALAALFSGQNASDSLFDHQIAARLKVGAFQAFGVEARDVDTVFTIGETGLSLTKLAIGDLAGATIRASGRAEGGLLAYSGAGDVAINAVDPTAFLGMLRQHLPSHPVLDGLVRQAGWYADTNLLGRVEFGDKQGGGLNVALSGTSRDSRITATYRQDDLLDLMGTSASSLEAQIENREPAVLLGQFGLSPLMLDGDGDARITLSLRRPSAEAPADGTFAFTTGQTSFKAEGEVMLSPASYLDGQVRLSISSADLEPYLQMNGIALPQPGAGLPLEGSAMVAATGSTVSVSDLSLVAGGNAIEGSLALDRPSGLMKGSGALKVDVVDLDWLAESVLGGIFDPVTGALSAGPLPIAPPSGLDYGIELTAKTFSVGLISPVADMSSRLTFKDSAVRLDDVRGTWLGGTVDGQVSVTNAEGSGFVQARLSLDGGELAQVHASGAQPPASGTFDLSLALEGTGKTAADLLGQVNGTGSVSLSGVTARQLDLGLFGPLLAEADTIEGEIGSDKVESIVAGLIEGTSSELGAVSLPFNITGGVLRAQNIAAGNTEARVSGDIKLTLASGELDAGLTVSLLPGEEALAGADPTFRLGYRGSLEAPERSIDVGELTNYLSLRAFERERRRVETLQANVLEKQRLRREVALYRYQERQRVLAREKAEAEEKVRLEQEAIEAADQAAVAKAAAEAAEAQRLQDAAAAEAADRAKAEADAAAQEATRAAAEAEAARQAAEQEEAQPAASTPPEPVTTQSVPPVMPVAPRDKVTRGQALPPVKFEGLPGVR